tara:strand:- start:51 stop:230 length:180 start_codon:yes stop_codon:yes gene_type:complete
MKHTIKQKLTKINWTIKQLHLVSGVRYATLSEFINGNKQISFENLEIICKVLNLELKEL